MTVKQAIFNMIKLFNQKKRYIITGVLILAVSINVFVPLLEKSNTNSDAFAQWLEYYPHYPNRLKYIIAELNQAGQDLEYFNRKLEGLIAQCDCEKTVSVCGGNISGGFSSTFSGNNDFSNKTLASIGHFAQGPVEEIEEEIETEAGRTESELRAEMNNAKNELNEIKDKLNSVENASETSKDDLRQELNNLERE